MIRNFNELLDFAINKKNIVVGVPAAEDDTTIKTIILAKQKGIANFIVTGKKDKIEELLKKNNADNENIKIIDIEDSFKGSEKIVELANQGKVNVILKGFLPTASLMKPILDKEKGLRTEKLLSDILIVENPLKENELLGMADGGLNILPDLNQKKEIIKNSVEVFHKLGYENPNVGIMAAVESVKDSMPATIDAKELTEMNKRGEIKGCNVYGPLALDIAVSRQAAEHKGITNPVAGNVQIMIMPNIESGNIFGKSFTYYLKIPVSHVIMGAKIPILIPSRNEKETDKLYSIALGVIIA